MNLPAKQSHIVQKIMTMPNGVRVFAVFALREANGQISAELIFARPLDGQDNATYSASFEAKTVLALPSVSVTEHILPKKTITSPYIFTALKDLSFFTSQPTRAPSFSL